MTTCLIVDDDPMSCKVAANIAGSLGLEVHIEPNGLAAILFCEHHMPDIIILDIIMPKMDGIAFLHELHKMLGGRRPYVIACTVSRDLETVQKLKKEGVKAYIAKPFETNVLETKIKESGLV